MKKSTARLIPLLTAGMVPASALTSAMLAQPAAAAPGDLDPGFGDVGRLGPILNSPAWSLELQDDGSILLGGGSTYPAYYYYYGYYSWNFVAQISDTGLIDSGFSAEFVQSTEVLDVARQPDGMVVATGRWVNAYTGAQRLVLFRLQSDGSLDRTFATEGLFELASADVSDQHAGGSMVLDPDGRIVVAGSYNDNLIVVRLLQDGSLDDSFGTAGVFTGPEALDSPGELSGGRRTNILRTGGDGYRVTVSDPAGCHIVGLTGAGVMDNTFGTAGIATVSGATGTATYCNSMAAQANGSLVVAGATDAQGFAARVLADGQPDPGFDTSAVSSALTEATAVAVGQDDSVVVAGVGVSGATIMRLQATGELDALFGNAGATLIDLPVHRSVLTVVRDMQVAPNGTILAAGAADFTAFIVRLLGAGDDDSPGVLGIADQSVISTVEGVDEVVVNVRRTGGASGAVSVAYQTTSDYSPAATSGEDYNPVSGRLTWADGDTADQQIQVQILSNGGVDPEEYVQMKLSNVEGGAGLGARTALIRIAGDGAPFGQFNFGAAQYDVSEGGAAVVYAARDYYSTGAVSVTLTPYSGSATAGSDFNANPVTLTWDDGELGWKSATFTTIDDDEAEAAEVFTVRLSDPTGGALIGQLSTASVSILSNDKAFQRSARRGGGTTGILSLLLLGFMSILRRVRSGK